MDNKERLFDSFPPVTTREWMDKILSDLKGADFNKKLVWKTNEGFDVRPFYRMEDTSGLPYMNTLPGEYPWLRGTRPENDWYIRQDIEVSDYRQANRKALYLLERGVNSLGFNIYDPESVCEENFKMLLKGICQDKTELNFICNGKAIEIVENLIKESQSQACSPDSIKGAVETDPIGRLMINGKLCIPVDAGLDYLASLFRKASSVPHLHVLQINASLFGNSGAGIVEELAFAISMAVEYLSQLTSRDISAEYAASRMRFSFDTGSDYFMEIAGLRAARLLWSAVAEAYRPQNAGSFKMMIHCVTTQWNNTIYDPYVNLLRTQTAAMSASLGGAGSITVLPFDIVFRKPGEFSERIARNQQLLLKEEAHFDKVTDPAAGSYFIENLTRMVADASWKLFLDVEEMGGFLEALKEGFIQDRLARSAERRKEDIARRREILLGTNLYPDTDETIGGIDTETIFNRTSRGDDLLVVPISVTRGAEDFERIRLAVDAAVHRPSVFLLETGDPVMRRARAQFSSAFFACAGYKIMDSNSFCNVEEGMNVAAESKADIIVICSSDDEYPEIAPSVYERLRDRAIIVVAGSPPCIEELKAGGIEHFISVRSDIVAELKKFNRLTGIEK
jgi:methylmalonyl-CoA mutase